jgi:hypothetical protein
MEVTREQIQNMLREFDGEIRQEKLDGRAILQQSETNLPAMQKIGNAVFARWASLMQR